MPIWEAIRKNIRKRRDVFWFVHRTNSCLRRKRLTNKKQRNIRGAYRPRRSAKGKVPRNACRSSINTNRHLRPVTPVCRAENRCTMRDSVHTFTRSYEQGLIEKIPRMRYFERYRCTLYPCIWFNIRVENRNHFSFNHIGYLGIRWNQQINKFFDCSEMIYVIDIVIDIIMLIFIIARGASININRLFI